MGFNSAFKGLMVRHMDRCTFL